MPGAFKTYHLPQFRQLATWRAKAAHIQTQRRTNSKADCRIAAEVCRQIADEMTTIAQDLDARDGAEALLLVNGFGGTPTIELYLMYNAARRMLEKRGLRISRSLVGSFVTSLDMAGCSLTVSLLDTEMTALWDHPVLTAALKW
jgi:phosphoenolpyruvate---glycerone phosphotransferase subunit DhaK